MASGRRVLSKQKEFEGGHAGYRGGKVRETAVD